MTANTYDNDRETLSALFDGELSGDASRFALKRLSHDEQWRDAFGRWQLCGDVLRGQAAAVASGDFAQRVASAITREHAPAMSQPVPKAALLSGRRGWIGGALAASVAVAALFVARPLTNGSTPVDATQAQVAEASSVRLNAAPEVPASKTPLAPDPSAPNPAVDLGTAAVAAAEVPRRAIERRSSRSQSQRAALRASTRREPAAVAVAASAAPATAATAATTALAADAHAATANVAASANPFQPRPSEAVARPWPRAVLPQYSSQGGINASYSGADSPSFYPFEPSMPQEATQATVERNPPPH